MKEFHCPHCKVVQGLTDGTRLQIQQAIFFQKTTWICANCEQTVRWRPVESFYVTVPSGGLGSTPLLPVPL